MTERHAFLRACSWYKYWGLPVDHMNLFIDHMNLLTDHVNLSHETRNTYCLVHISFKQVSTFRSWMATA